MVWSAGLIATAAGLGAVEGGGAQVVRDVEDQQKFDRETARDALLSKLRMGEYQAQIDANLAALPQRNAIEAAGAADKEAAIAPIKAQEQQTTSDIAVSQAQRMPRVVSPGATEVVPAHEETTPIAGEGADGEDVPGTMTQDVPERTFTAPTRLSAGQEAYYTSHAKEADARAARAQAEADAIDRGERYRAQQQAQPRFIKDDHGNMLDVNSGAYGKWVDPVLIKPKVTHWKGDDEPAVYSQGHYEWFDAQNQPLPGGIGKLYPTWKIGQQAQNSGGSSSAIPPGDLDYSDQGEGRPAQNGGAAASDTQGEAPKGPPQTLPLPDGQGSANFTGRFTTMGRPIYSDGKRQYVPDADTPPARYPDARRAPDGFFYVRRNGSYYRVVNDQPSAAKPAAQPSPSVPAARSAAPADSSGPQVTFPSSSGDESQGLDMSARTSSVPTRAQPSAGDAEAIGLQLDAARQYLASLGAAPPMRKADLLQDWIAKHDAAVRRISDLESQYASALGDAVRPYVGSRIGGLHD